MSRPPGPLPDSVPWRVVTRGEALAAGISPERLRRKDLTRLRRDLLARADCEHTEGDIAAAICRSERDATVVGRSAARLHRIPLPGAADTWTPDHPVEIAVPGGRRTVDDVVRWRSLVLGADDIRSASYRLPHRPDGEGLPLASVRITTRPRTWRDLASLVSEDWLVVVGDHLVHRPRPGLEQNRTAPWCTPDELARACTGRRAPELRRALEKVRVGADSPRETLLRLAFSRAGLPPPELNVPLVGDDGTPHHCPDFLWPRYRVCIEYEGRAHNGKAQIERDIERARRVARAGWVEVRLSAKDVRYGYRDAADTVREALIAAGWRP